MSDKKKSLKQIKLRHIIGLAIFCVLLYILINAINIWNYGKVDEKRQTDVAIVLGAGTQNDEVTPVFRERLNHGIWLYENGYIKKLILTGGYGEGNEHSDAYVAKMYVEAQGVPEADILLEETSTITQENIENAKAVMDNENYTTAILVSDPLHMKRSMLMAADYGIEAYSSPTPTTRYISPKSKVPFLARELFFYVGYKVYRLFPNETAEKSEDKFYTITEESKTYILHIKDINGNTIFKEECETEPIVTRINDDTLMIIRGKGDWHTYTFVNVRTSLVSENFDDVSAWNHQKVAYATYEEDSLKIIVQDIYDKEKYYLEIIRDYTPVAIPHHVILNAEFVNHSQLMLDYYSGENYEVKKEIIEL